MKIVYCLNSIRILGGIEMVTVVKANALAEIEGNEVYVVVTDNKGGIEISPLSSKVKLIDLDVNYFENGWKSRWRYYKELWAKNRLHKKRLKKVLYDIMPDIVVSTGLNEKNMLPAISGGWALVREFHIAKNYRSLYAHSAIDKIVLFFGNIYDFHYRLKKYDTIVTLTQEDKERNWNNSEHISVIPNPITFKSKCTSDLGKKRIITVGRLAWEKNFQSLIRSYKYVANEHPDWILEIYGEGTMRKELEDLTNQLQLNDNVYLKGYTSQVYEKMQEASCFVMSSKLEGLPLVLLEAMQCGLPCVSYDCPCGPKDIITDGKDGFLVPLGDEKVLAEKICYLIEHPDVRNSMGQAALMKAEKYNIDNIIPMWMDLFNRLMKQRKL